MSKPKKEIFKYTIIIPARYDSTRLPAKLLEDINGKPLIVHTYLNACKTKASRIIVAADDQRIKDVCEKVGAKVYMTGKHHQCGTSRVSEVVKNIETSHPILNVQGDEPMLSPSLIDKVAYSIYDTNCVVSTLCVQLKTMEEYNDPNVVKVVFNKNNRAMYFSRSPIPAFRDGEVDLSACYKHIGLYGYKSTFLKRRVSYSRYEEFEKLEQLSILNNGINIHVEVADEYNGYSIDTIEDLNRYRNEF